MNTNENLKKAKAALDRAIALKREKKAAKDRDDLASNMAKQLSEVLKNANKAYVSLENEDAIVTTTRRDQSFLELLKGDKGEKGDTGEKGDRGERGERGSTGERGQQGEEGRTGLQGRQGYDGRPGRDGKNGKDGKEGKRGEDGRDGSPDMANEIVRKINSLPIDPHAQIDASHIKNLPMMISGFVGRRTTTSGLTVQAPLSGTVDGSNTVFNFDPVPSGISVDQGRIMQRVSSDGTINWTVVGNTITLTVAPNFDIFGL